MKNKQEITIYYTETNDGIKILSIGNNCASSITIPETIDGKTVTEIAPFAFACADASSLQDEPTVATLAFVKTDTAPPKTKQTGDRLTRIILPDSIHTIGENAFEGCTALTHIHLPERITSLSAYLFSDCAALENLYLPKNLNEIAPYAFYNCQRLQSLRLPDGLTAIGKYAFYNCRQLREINIPAATVTLGTGMFLNCDNLYALHFGRCRHISDIISGLNHELLLEIDFPDGHAKLLLPDFQYEYIEDTPARMLHQVNYGSGHLFRQAIGNNDIDFRRYDELFYMTKREDNDELVLLLVISRLTYPYRLPNERRENYLSYLREHLLWATAYYKNELPILQAFADWGLFTAENIESVLDHLQRKHAKPEILSFLMDYQHKLLASGTKQKKTFEL